VNLPDIFIIGVSILFTVLTFFIVFFAVQFNARVVKHQKEIDINKEEKELALLQATIDAQEDERKSIGADLHDDIGPMLTVVQMKLNQLQLAVPETNKENITEIKDSVKEAIAGVRGISQQLVPAVFEMLGLKAALKSELPTIADSGAINLDLKLDFDYTLLSTETQLAIYRILKEATNNVMKHAQSRNLFIYDEEQNSGKMNICVEDDGIGFKENETDSGLGLRNMRARARAMGGEITIVPRPQGGTKLTLNFPSSSD